MERRDLFEQATFDSVLARIEQLSPTTQAAWGTMSVDRMLAHCSEVLEVAAGKPLKNTPWFIKLLGGFIRKSVLSAKPYARNLRTHPQYVVSDPQDFDVQRDRLRSGLLQMKESFDSGRTEMVHALFGPMTRDEVGWAMYKHLDHHLTQFGV